MFCGECGTQNPDTNQFCKNCGKPLRRPQQVPAPQPVTANQPFQVTPINVPNIPISQPPAQGTALPIRNWFAIISFIISLLSWLVYPIIFGFIAVILGIFSLYWAKKMQTKIPVSAIIGIVIGLLAIVLNFFWLDIFPAPAVLPPIK